MQMLNREFRTLVFLAVGKKIQVVIQLKMQHYHLVRQHMR